MSKIQRCVTKFEILPNEILIDCFQHLDGLDIFYAFDDLNYRLSKLIQNISLHLNFQYVNKSRLVKLCRIILSNPKMKGKVYSLHISNKETFFQIETFLSFFSLNEFVNLRSLTVTGASNKNIEKLRLILSSIPQLCRLNLVNESSNIKITLADLPMSKLRMLSIVSINSPLTSIHEISSIKTLTISHCFIDNDLYKLLKHTPMLKYLNIQYLADRQQSNTNIFNAKPCAAVYLKQLVIGDAMCTLEEFEIFIKQTPNLESLTISATNNQDMLRVYHWEQLITDSLPKLTIFKFKFDATYLYDEYHAILNRFDYFQTEFWKKRHWFTEYIIQNQSISIYTIPYISNTFKLTPDTIRYSNQIIDNYDEFNSGTMAIKRRKPWSEKTAEEAMLEEVYRYKRWRNMVNTHVMFPVKNQPMFSRTHKEQKKRKRTETEMWYRVHNLNYYDKFNIFDNVTNLTLNWEILTGNYQYYFSNVTSLTLVPSSKIGNRVLGSQHIAYLKETVYLSNLNHLNIEQVYRIESSLVLLELLKEAPQLSSITFNPKVLMAFFNDGELCKYLNKMMKKVFLTDCVDCLSRNSEKLKQFSEIFSNIEYLECEFNFPNNLLEFLNCLPKLSGAKITAMNQHHPGKKFSWFQNQARQSNNLIFDINHKPFICYRKKPSEYYNTTISIWIGKNMS